MEDFTFGKLPLESGLVTFPGDWVCLESNSHSRSSLFDVIPKALFPHILRDFRISKLLFTSKRGPKASEGVSDTCALKK